MCFLNYSDADWTALSVSETTAVVNWSTRCDECGAAMPPGTEFHLIKQSEYAGCKRCDPETRADYCWHEEETWDGESDLPPCPEGQCDYGETYEYIRCLDCDRFLQAIEVAELEAGCGPWESRPRLEKMTEELREAGAAECRRHYHKAREMFPDLHTGGYLPRLWQRLFGQ